MTTDKEKFMLLLSHSQPDLRRYIYSLCYNSSDMEDILQETSLALWRKFDSYDSTQPFLNWAFRFAYYETMKFSEKQKRSCQLCENTLKILAEEYESDIINRQEQRRALKFCVQKLDSDEQHLVDLRYGQKMTVKSMNDSFGETGKKIYRALERLRFKLFKCIQNQLHEEGF